MSYGDCEAAIAYIDRISANCAALANGDFPADIPPSMKQEAIDGLKNMLRNAVAGMFEMRLKSAYANYHKDLASQAVNAAASGGVELAQALANAQSNFARNKGKTASALQGKVTAASKNCSGLKTGIASVMNDV